MANNEKITLLNRAGHAPKLRDTVVAATDGYVLTWDATNKGWYPSDAGAGGSSAPASAEYLVLEAHSGLTSERVLTLGGGLAKVDGGAGAALTLNLQLDGVSLQISGGNLEVKAGGITPAKLSFQPRKDAFTGNGIASAFNLSTRILEPSWRDGVVVARNGQLLTQVAGDPSGVGQYEITDNGTNTAVNLGAALPTDDQLAVMYWA